MRPNGIQETAEKARYRIKIATSNDLGQLVRMQLALQSSMTRIGTNVLHLNRSGTVRLYDYYEQQMRDDQARLLLACDTSSEAIVAMGLGRIWLHPDYVPARSGELIDLWVDPEHRRRGLGGRIVGGLLKFFKASRVEFLSVNYVRGNPAAEALWKSLGFQPTLVTATTERRTAETLLEAEARPIIPVEYRSAMNEQPVRAGFSLLG